jgi:ferredoxin--NADP+ reductase
MIGKTMPSPSSPVADDSPIHSACLIARSRLTPADSREDVRQMIFASTDPGFDAEVGHCIRVLAPGQFGNRYHARLYSLADIDRSDPHNTEFSLLVRRCDVLDDFSGERYAGVASNYLCDLPMGSEISYCGPVGHPFAIPARRSAPLLMIGMGTGIAPFRGLVRRIYDSLGGWDAPVRLFYGARSGLEMLYMNSENQDLANYFDQSTFKAFQALSPRPHFDEAPALGGAIESHAAEVREMLDNPETQVFIAGPQAMLARVEESLSRVLGSTAAWEALRQELQASGRWNLVLY